MAMWWRWRSPGSARYAIRSCGRRAKYTSPARAGEVSVAGAEDDVLCAFPQHHLAQRDQVLAARFDRQEVVSGKLHHHAGELPRAVRQQDRGLAEAAGIQQDLARPRIARVVLIAEAEFQLAERYPA